ncbi:extracellular solute-binding protein, partial [Mycolicibacterium poriferae]|uniref:extracellular solute-binding protein n=1 Tax=Mycolicibacterium poriferae TaxID=39694 RepID=UPI00321A4A6B
VHANFLRSSIVAAGLDPDNLPESDKSKMNFQSGGNMEHRAWREAKAAEIEAGAAQPDVLLIADTVTLEGMAQAGHLAAYASPESAAYDSALYSAEGYYHSTKLITTGIVYNTGADSVPTSWADLAKPEMAGLVAMPSPLYSGAALIHLATLTETDGLGWDYYVDLAGNKTQAEGGNGGTFKAVASGEKPYGVLVDFMALRAKAEGSPVEFVFPEEGVSYVTEPVAILSTADNMDAAQKFVDFLLSEAGQQLVVEMGYIPARNGMPSPEGFPSRDEITLMDFDPAKALAYLRPAAPKIPLVSTVAYAGSEPLYSADYWAANLRNPVRFSQAVHEAGADHANFIEISPHPLLTHAISDTLAAQPTSRSFHVGATVNRDHPETVAFHAQLAAVRPPAVKLPDGAAGAHLADVPPTAWQHEPYWMADRSTGREFSGAHPLLGMHVELPSGHGHVWQSDVGLDPHPWLGDHLVHGLPVMPGAGFAEIVLAAGCEALGRPADAVEAEVAVEQMLPLDQHTKLTTQLSTAEDGSLRVEVHSRSDAGTWTRHAVGTVRAAEPATPARLGAGPQGSVISPADFYTAVRRTGAHHAQAFAALTRIVRATDSADTEIVLPDEATPHRGMILHPVMLDAALQGLAAAMSDATLAEATDVTFLPVGFESIRVFGEVGRRAKCRAELLGVREDSGDAQGRVTLTDETGAVLARVDGVQLKRIQRRTVPLPLSQKIFDTRWAELSAPAAGSPTGSWLVLADGAAALATATDFADRFGGPQRKVVTADLADDAAVRDGFEAATSAADLPPAGVVVVMDHRAFDGTDAEGALARTRDVLWRIAGTVRTLVGSWHGKPPRVWLGSRGGLVVTPGDAANPGVSSMNALVRVLAYEHPDLRVTLVDTGADTDAVTPLITEIDADGTDDVVAWRAGSRYVERLSRATLPAAPGRLVVRADGSYVVTGALGGVGMAVVRWLVDNGAGRLVLNGRSAASAEVQATLDELSGRAEIVTVLGDITAPGVAERLVATAEETGKPLRGVIHSAAVLDDELVVGLTRESLERIWAPKAGGAWRLHEVTADKELDFWVGFSSVAALLGSPGQAAYACANAWLDALVAWRRAAGLPATTIDWGQWAEVGLASSLRFSVLDPITPDEGVDALGGVLAAGLTRVGVARLRLDRAAAAFPEINQIGFFADLVGELDVDDADEDWAGPEALKEMDAAEVNRVVLARLRRRISAIMGYSDESAVDIARPLTEIGLDSLMAVRMRNTIRGDFGVEPPVALLLQGANLADVALDLIRQLGLEEQESAERPNALRDRAQQRAAARQRAASRRKVGPRS